MRVSSQLGCRRTMYFAPLLIVLLVTVGCSSSPPLASSPSASRAARPRLLNEEQMVEAILAEFPPELRALRTSGVVTLMVNVGTDGSPQEVRVLESSGYLQFDEAAMRVAVFLRFSPALLSNGDPVASWVSFPIRFGVRTARGSAVRLQHWC